MLSVHGSDSVDSVDDVDAVDTVDDNDTVRLLSTFWKAFKASSFSFGSSSVSLSLSFSSIVTALPFWIANDMNVLGRFGDDGVCFFFLGNSVDVDDERGLKLKKFTGSSSNGSSSFTDVSRNKSCGASECVDDDEEDDWVRWNIGWNSPWLLWFEVLNAIEKFDDVEEDEDDDGDDEGSNNGDDIVNEGVDEAEELKGEWMNWVYECRLLVGVASLFFGFSIFVDVVVFAFVLDNGFGLLYFLGL